MSSRGYEYVLHVHVTAIKDVITLQPSVVRLRKNLIDRVLAVALLPYPCTYMLHTKVPCLRQDCENAVNTPLQIVLPLLHPLKVSFLILFKVTKPLRQAVDYVGA